MGRTMQPENGRLRVAAKRKGNDVVEFQVGMLWSAGGVGRGVGTVACAHGSADDFGAEVAVSGAVADRLARTGVLPPQVSRPDDGAGSAATAEVGWPC